MTTISSYYSETEIYTETKQKSTKPSHKHVTKAEGRYQGDNFVCTNKKDVKKWLECAKKNGSCDGITYTPESSYLLVFTHPATFSYKTKPGDTPQSVREMFNLKPGALKRYDDYIFNIHEPYQGKVVTFAEEDILP